MRLGLSICMQGNSRKVMHVCCLVYHLQELQKNIDSACFDVFVAVVLCSQNAIDKLQRKSSEERSKIQIDVMDYSMRNGLIAVVSSSVALTVRKIFGPCLWESESRSFGLQSSY